MQFKIEETGVISGLFARAPHPKLEEEAKRIMQLLPNMKAGKQGGKDVAVKFTLPMRIDVD